VKAVTVALWAQTLLAVGTYLVGKEVTARVDPLTVISTRSVLSGVILAGLLVALGRPLMPQRALWPKLIVFGFLAGPINQGAFLYGLSKTHASHASLLYALTPAGVYLGGLLLGRERVARRRVVGIAVAFAGVTVLLLGKGLAEAAGSLVGDAWVLCAVVAWVVVTIEGRKLALEMGPLKASAWMLVVAAVFMLFAAPFVLEVDALRAAEPLTLAGVAYLILFSSVGSYLLWNFALSRAEASAVAVFTNLQPVGTAVAAVVLLHEPITAAMIAGGVLVLGGVRLVSSNGRAS
jgi:drug/metabolite transporter (DMT)-like permease